MQLLDVGIGKDSSQKDAMFETHYKGLKEAGIKVGAYLYSYCSNVNNAILEAKNCLELIKGKTFELPIFYDLEDKITKVLGRVAISQIAINFCEEIEKNGYKAGIYANLDWFKNYIELSKVNKYKIWLAQWDVEKPTANFHYDYWQYTSKGQLIGINENVDMNYCYDEILASNENTVNKVEKSIELLAIEVINGVYGNGQERKDKLSDKFNEVQDYVNKILINNDITSIANNVIKGIYGNGQERKKILGILYNKVQDKVNQILRK